MKRSPAEKSSDTKAEPYRSFLLRLWRTDGEACSWRASLDEMRTGQRIGFPGLEELFAYLMEQSELDAGQRFDGSTRRGAEG